VSLILAIDPGTTESGLVLWRDGKVTASGITTNDEVFDWIRSSSEHATVAIEMIASYGMPVGREVFETCVWIGRFVQVAGVERVRLIYRRDVKLHLCGSPRAKDANIRQALIDRLGPPGTKKAPGGTYGIRSHAWPALAVAVTAADLFSA
jgi:hypothetical protein